MAAIELKTAKGNIARISVDTAKYKGKGRDAFISAEIGYWDRAYSGVSRERIEDALGKLWDTAHPAKAPKTEASAE